MKYPDIIKLLKAKRNPRNIAGMARFGINPHKTLGVPIPILRSMARKIGRDHKLADRLWRSGYHEARILASMIDDPKLVTPKQMDRWVVDFDSWDVCDQVCTNLFRYTRYGHQKAVKWSRSGKEFVRRAGYTMMAVLTVSDKSSPDSRFAGYLPLIIKASTDERNFVKKAVNWALRQIGKKNRKLKLIAMRTANDIIKLDSRSARWIAADALRELRRR